MRFLFLLMLLINLGSAGESLSERMWRVELGSTTGELLTAVGRKVGDEVVGSHDVLAAMVTRLSTIQGARVLTKQEEGLVAIWCLDGLIFANGLDTPAIELVVIDHREAILDTAVRSGLTTSAAWIRHVQSQVPPLPVGPPAETPIDRADRIQRHLASATGLGAAEITAMETKWTDAREEDFEDRLLAWVRTNSHAFTMPVRTP